MKTQTQHTRNTERVAHIRTHHPVSSTVVGESGDDSGGPHIGPASSCAVVVSHQCQSSSTALRSASSFGWRVVVWLAFGILLIAIMDRGAGPAPGYHHHRHPRRGSLLLWGAQAAWPCLFALFPCLSASLSLLLSYSTSLLSFLPPNFPLPLPTSMRLHEGLPM